MRALLLSLALLLPMANSCPAEQPPKPSRSCAEDDPCWDCKTMGNKKCGPNEKQERAA